MKKKIALLLSISFILLILSGCGTESPTGGSNTPLTHDDAISFLASKVDTSDTTYDYDSTDTYAKMGDTIRIYSSDFDSSINDTTYDTTTLVIKSATTTSAVVELQIPMGDGGGVLSVDWNTKLAAGPGGSFEGSVWRLESLSKTVDGITYGPVSMVSGDTVYIYFDPSAKKTYVVEIGEGFESDIFGALISLCPLHVIGANNFPLMFGMTVDSTKSTCDTLWGTMPFAGNVYLSKYMSTNDLYLHSAVTGDTISKVDFNE